MPRREERLKMLAKIEAAKTDPTIAAELRKHRRAAKKAAAARAAKKTGLAEPTTQQQNAKQARSKMAELRRSLAGQGERIVEAMKRAGKTEEDIANATGVHAHSIRAVLKDRSKTMMDRNIAKIAAYLGANYGQLRAGVDAEMPVRFTIDVADQPDRSGAEPALVPHATTVKANGRAHHNSTQGRMEAAMRTNLQTAMGSLWTLMPLDVQVMLISKMAELFAAHQTRQQ